MKKAIHRWKCGECEKDGGDPCFIETRTDKKIVVNNPEKCIFCDKKVKWKKIKSPFMKND
jgi:hypothetical protein